MTDTVELKFSAEESRDLDHYRAQPGAWDVRVNQLGMGDFGSLVRSVELPGIIIYANHWNAACQIIGESPSDWFMLGAVYTRGRLGSHWCGQRIDQTVFACASPNKEVEFTIEERTQDLVILVRPKVLEKLSGFRLQKLIQNQQHIRFSTTSGLALVHFALDLIERLEVLPQLRLQPKFLANAQSNLLWHLEKCFAGMFNQDLMSTPKIRQKAFHASVFHVAQNPQKVTAWSMAQAAGVSQKTLEVAFRECIGMTPGKYLAIVRLNGVHKDLCQTNPSAKAITRIALDWGFSNFHRFRTAYRQLFGELPSQTLKSSRF